MDQAKVLWPHYQKIHLQKGQPDLGGLEAKELWIIGEARAESLEVGEGLPKKELEVGKNITR